MKKVLKKIFILVLAGCVMFNLAACGSTQKSSPSVDNTETSASVEEIEKAEIETSEDSKKIGDCLLTIISYKDIKIDLRYATAKDFVMLWQSMGQTIGNNNYLASKLEPYGRGNLSDDDRDSALKYGVDLYNPYDNEIVKKDARIAGVYFYKLDKYPEDLYLFDGKLNCHIENETEVKNILLEAGLDAKYLNGDVIAEKQLDDGQVISFRYDPEGQFIEILLTIIYE